MAKKDCSELAQSIDALLSAIAADPDIKTFDDAVFAMKKVVPGITREIISESVIEATEGRRIQIDALTKKVNAIRNEPRLEKATKRKAAKLEQLLKSDRQADAARKIPKGSDALETLRSTSKNLTKWLKNNNPTAEKRLQAKLDQLQGKIASGDIDPRRQPRTEFREPVKQLQQQIKNARKTITDARSIAKVENQIDALNKHLEEGTLPESAKKDKFVSEPMQLVREIRDDLKKKLSQSEPAQRKRLQSQIDNFNKILKDGVSLPSPKIVVPQGKELERLQFKRDELQREIRRRISDLKPRSIFSKLIQDPFNAARNIMTAFDFSAVFRQGGFIAVGHPVRAIKNLTPMFKAFSSEQRQDKIAKDIKDRPNAPLYRKAGLFLAPTDGSYQPTKQEEILQSKLIRSAEKALPGLAGSNRAYITFLNQLRADSFDIMAAGLSRSGEVTLDEAKAIAKYVNVATGRGNLGVFEKAAQGLNVGFFAPRYVASRFQLLGGLVTQPIKALRGDRVAKQVTKEYARYLIGMTAVYALAALTLDDEEFELDPRSSDFGKIKIGNTRLDPLSGISQVTVLLSRLVSGKLKSSTTGNIVPLNGEDVGFGKTTTVDILSSFLRYKLSPLFGTILSLRLEEDPVGQPFGPEDLPKSLLIPLSFKEIFETMREQGMVRGTIISTLAIFGMGVQTYGSTTQGKTEERTTLK